MVLTLTVVGNNQGNGPGGHAVLSPNELAQLMSGQTVTGLLNPDGSITLNTGVIPGQQMTPISTTTPNGPPPITTSAVNYHSRPQADNIQTTPSNSNSNIQTMSGDPNNLSAINTSQTTTNQKKTGTKRMSAKQKLAQQQQQVQLLQQNQAQQMQLQDTRHLMSSQPDQSLNQQPQIVATVQLPNGQIGQLIAPSGGQFWSPNAINLQQLSMAVAAATGTMPQTMSLPTNSPAQGQQTDSPALQQQQQQSMQTSPQLQQGTQQSQHQSSQSLSNPGQQQVMTTMQLPGNQMVGRQAQNQLWSGGSISLSQLSALAQQGVVQLSPVQGIPTTSPNGQRVIEMIPQAAIQGLLNQNGQPIQTLPPTNGSQFITQDPNDPSKWQFVTSNQIPTQDSNVQASSTNHIGNPDSSSPITRNSSLNQFNSSSQVSEGTQASQPQRKLKRLACTCPNCRDGDSSRNNGDKKKQHICHFPECNKVYGKTSHLRAHLRWHSGKI